MRAALLQLGMCVFHLWRCSCIRNIINVLQSNRSMPPKYIHPQRDCETKELIRKIITIPNVFKVQFRPGHWEVWFSLSMKNFHHPLVEYVYCSHPHPSPYMSPPPPPSSLRCRLEAYTLADLTWKWTYILKNNNCRHLQNTILSQFCHIKTRASEVRGSLPQPESISRKKSRKTHTPNMYQGKKEKNSQYWARYMKHCTV